MHHKHRNSTPAKSDERFSISTPTVLDSANATDESPSTLNPKSPVSMVLHLMKQRQHYISADQSRQLKVKLSEYNSLLARLQQLPELQIFVNDKLRIQSLGGGPLYKTYADNNFTKASRNECQKKPKLNCNTSKTEMTKLLDSQNEYLADLRRAAWTYIQYSNANIKAVVGFELGYGTKKEARISMWKPRYSKDDEEGLETLDVGAVFRSSDGFAINTTKALHLPLDCFADSEVATFDSEELPGITITYPQLAEFLDKAERLQRTKQPVLGEESIGKKSRR
ncbi:hypothetical protein IFR04_000274 [Cadophora malorum]|uniref:Uncharacterized protein n=1 Tax=Cadophora malorum TaxID=108018 RepID=A0A8H7WLG1_9HELO|nr:hypothetical protein IFR04_000274 [Cadophora malorum]